MLNDLDIYPGMEFEDELNELDDFIQKDENKKNKPKPSKDDLKDMLEQYFNNPENYPIEKEEKPKDDLKNMLTEYFENTPKSNTNKQL